MGEYEAYDKCRTKGIPSEVVAGRPAWVNLREVVHEAILVNDGHSASCLLVITTNHGGNRPEKACSDQPVGKECKLVLALKSALILPWNAFWVGRILSEAIGYPRIAHEVLLQPIDVLDFHLASGNGGHSLLEHFVCLPAQLPHFLVLLVIKDRLSESFVVCGVVLTRHVVLLFN